MADEPEDFELERQHGIAVIKRELLMGRMYRGSAIAHLGHRSYEELIAGLTDDELALVMSLDR